MAAALRVSATGYNNGTAQVVGVLTGVQAGDGLTVQFRERDGVSITSISDDVNGAWSVASTRAATAARAGIYYRQNSGAGTVTITITFSGTNQPSDAVFAAWSGLQTSSLLGAVNSAGNSPATSSHSPGSITPASSALVLLAVGTGVDHGGATPPSGFTLMTPHASATANLQIYAYKVSHTGAITATSGTTNNVTSDAVVASFLEAAAADEIAQTGYRFRADDGDEDGATWLAAQDAPIVRQADTPTRLRLLLQAIDDPATAAFGLQARRNAGSWFTVAPPVSATAPTFGAIGTGGGGTTSCTPTYPSGITAASALFLVVTGRSNTATTAFAVTGGGWTLVGTAELEGGTGTWGVDTGTRRVAVYRKDTVSGSESGTITVTLAGTASNTLYASIVRVETPAGHTLTVDGVSGADTSNGTGYSAAMANTLALAPDDLLLIATAQNIDSGTVSSTSLTGTGLTFGTITNRRTQAVTNGNDHRHIVHTAPVATGTATVELTWAYTISASGSGPTAIVRIRAVPVVAAVELAPSAHIAGSAATSTTAQLSGGTGSFTAGRISDDTNPLPSVDVGDDGNTEVEWCVTAPSSVVDDEDVLEFRVVRGGSPLDAYTVTPEWEIGTPSSGPDASGALLVPPSTLAAGVTVTRTAAAAMTAPRPVLAAAGTVQRTTSGVLVTPAATLAASAVVTRTASGVLVAGPATLAATAGVVRAAAADLEAPGATLAASADVARAAAGALGVPAPSLAATGAVDRTVAGDLETPAATLSGNTGGERSAEGALVAPGATLTADAGVTRTATGAAALPPATLAAGSVITREASAAFDAGAPTLAASSAVARAAIAAPVAPALALEAATEVARTAVMAATTSASTLSATSGGDRSVAGDLVVPPTEADAAAAVTRAATVAHVVPAPALAAASAVDRQAAAAIVSPSLQLSAVIGVARTVAATLEVGPLSLAAAADAGRVVTAGLVLPPATLSADVARLVHVAAASALPSPHLAAALAVVRFADGELALVAPVLAGGALDEALSVSAVLAAPVPVLDADGLVTRTATGALMLRAPVLDGDALRIAQVDAVLLLRTPTLASQGVLARLASGALTAPDLQLFVSSYVGALVPLVLGTTRVVSLTPRRTVDGPAGRTARGLTPTRTVRPR